MASPLLHHKSQLQRLHEIQQARPRIQRPSSCVQRPPSPQMSEAQTTLPHPIATIHQSSLNVSSNASNQSFTSCTPAVCAVSPSLRSFSPALNTGSRVSQRHPESHVHHTFQIQGPPAYPSVQGWFQNCPQPLRPSTPSGSTCDQAVSSCSPSPNLFQSHRRTKDSKADLVDQYRRLREDLDLLKRMKMDLPDGLMERIKRLHVQSSILEKLRGEDLRDSRAQSPSSPTVSVEVRKPLEELQQALSAMKAEQGAIRRMQEEELLELCKVRNLLEREEKEKKEKEREQEILQQIQQQKQAKEQQSKHDVALRVEQALLSQGARREEFLQAELRQLDQEEKEVERRNLELKRQAEQMQEMVSAMSERAQFGRSTSSANSAVSFTGQPKAAVQNNSQPISYNALPVTEAEATRSSVMAVEKPAVCPMTNAVGVNWTTGDPMATLPSPALPEPVCETTLPAPLLSPARCGETGNGAGKLAVGKGPLWRPSSSSPRSQMRAWTEEDEQQESLVQAYLAFINKEVESVPSLDPTPCGVSDAKHARGRSPPGGRQPTGFEGVPQVYRAAISIVAEHGWSALHGGENAGACWTALHWAAAEGRQDICQLLLQCRADADHQDEMGRFPAYYASLHGHADTLALLKNAGRQVSRQAAHETRKEEEDGPLMSAASTRASFLSGERSSTWSSAKPTHVSS